jgi:hypothetical protein
MNNELWGKIVTVHNTSKALFIWCEESDIRLNSFLQPNNELKNAWEHAIRAKANELGFTAEPANNADYIEANLDKVLGHEYRAFFDICDWLSVNLRKRIIDYLGPYDNEAINAVIPTYYTDIRPKYERFCSEIAKLRATKDIGKSHEIVEHVADYNGIVLELIGQMETISASVPALEEYKRKQKSSGSKGFRKELFLVALGAALFALGEWLVAKLSAGGKP